MEKPNVRHIVDKAGDKMDKANVQSIVPEIGKKQELSQGSSQVGVRFTAVVAMIHDRELRPSTKVLMTGILWRYKPGHQFSVNTTRIIARELDLGQRTYRRAIEELDERNHIEIRKEYGVLICPLVEYMLATDLRATLPEQLEFPYRDHVPDHVRTYINKAMISSRDRRNK